MKFIYYRIKFYSSFFRKNKFCKFTGANLVIEYYPDSYPFESAMWGLSAVKSEANCYVEHGYFWGSYVDSEMTKYSSVITTCRKRLNLLKKHHKHVKAIRYMDYFQFNDQLAEKLKTQDNCLLVLGHSTRSVFKSIDYVKAVSMAKSKWPNSNIQILAFHTQYDEICSAVSGFVGVEIISCGHRYDQEFLSRLKTLLYYSNHLVTNDVGSHILYASQLGRVFNYIDLAPEIRITNTNRHQKYIMSTDENEIIKDKDSVLQILLATSGSNEQLEALEEYFNG